jgi:acetyl-CoA carboxylase biotin carboxyl carrier protein
MLKVQEIRELIKLIDESSIDEFSYETEGTTVSMKKAAAEIDVQPTKQVVKQVEQPVEAAKTEPQPVEAKADTDGSQVQTTVSYDYEIESPMVGTLYTASSPEAGRFVEKGSKVQKDTVVCIVEAMKLFNEIEAEVNGEIVEILVEDGELVEYGQPLFRVKTK